MGPWNGNLQRDDRKEVLKIFHNDELDVSALVVTDVGLCALWDVASFESVRDLTSWEDQFDDDSSILGHIMDGSLVPLNVGGSGTFQVSVRGSQLIARESSVLLASSAAYALRTTGVVGLGGLEQIGSYVGNAFTFTVPEGFYSVTVHLIDWKSDANSVAADGSPREGALSDFVVRLELLEETEEQLTFRQDVSTFDR